VISRLTLTHCDSICDTQLLLRLESVVVSALGKLLLYEDLFRKVASVVYLMQCWLLTRLLRDLSLLLHIVYTGDQSRIDQRLAGKVGFPSD
jgi:hypothetical protein